MILLYKNQTNNLYKNIKKLFKNNFFFKLNHHFNGEVLLAKKFEIRGEVREGKKNQETNYRINASLQTSKVPIFYLYLY